MAAEIIKIELPVEVKDNTAAGISSITSGLNRMAQAATKTSKALQATGTYGKSSGFEKALEKMYKSTLSQPHPVQFTAEDNVTPIAAGIEDEISRLNGMDGGVDITANNMATMEILNAGDTLAEYNGSSGVADVDVDNKATEVINEANDALAEYDGNFGTAEIYLDSDVIPIISEADDAIAEFNGSSGVAEISTEDSATPVVHDAEDAIDTFDGSSGNAEIGVNDNATETIRNAMDMLDEYEKRIQNMSNLGSGLEGKLSTGGSNLKGLAMGAAGFLGVSMGIGSAINTFKDFEAGMSKVEAISGATGSEMAQLTDQAKALGATTKFTATQVSEGFNYMAMAGWKPEQMQGGIEGILNLAAASGESLGTTSDIVTDALTAFGLQAEDSTHFADVMAQASSNANTNVGMLGESFKYVAPLAGAMNYSIEDTALALGLMANAGVKGSMAGTSLRTAISNLAAPTKQMREGMEKYGISLTDDEGKMKTLRGVMENTRKALKGLSEDEQTAAIKNIFGKNSMSGIMAIVNASEDDWEKLADAVDNADGAAERMADTMMDNLAGSITLLQSAYEGVQDTFGERVAPYARGIVDAITGAMPDVSEAINNVMDKVDIMADKFETAMRKMTSSDEWQNADLLGKIDIAWDTLIAQPFGEWASGDGLDSISGIVSGLFENAFKILPGGEAPGITSWLSAGLIGFGGIKLAGLAGDFSKLAGSVSELVGADTILGQFATAAGGIAGPAMAAAAGIGILALAIHNYNAEQINDSLEKHFGNIELSPDQLSEIAKQVLDTEWTVNIDLALGELKNADKLKADAVAKLQDNQSLEYKATCGVELTLEEKETYASNVDAFIKSAQSELDGRTFAAKLLVDATLTSAEGKELSTMISEWTLSDNIELNNLSSSLTSAVQTALEAGVDDVDAWSVVHELEDKVNSVLDRWRKAESKAALASISRKYGRMSAAELTAGGYKDLISELRAQREANEVSLDETRDALYTLLYANEDRITAAGGSVESLMDEVDSVLLGEKTKELSNHVNIESNTMEDTYGSLVNQNRGQNAEGATGAVDFINAEFGRGVNGQELSDEINNQLGNMYTSSEEWNPLISGDQKALGRLYKEMKPDVQAMGEFISGAFDENGNQLYQIPQQIMDEYTRAVEIGAASGDVDAAWQVFANQLKESGDEKLVEGIRNGTVNAPEELRQALQRSFAETGDELSIEGIKTKIEDMTVSQESAQAIQDNISEFINSVNESGSTATYTADGIVVTLGEVDVDEPSAAEQIATAMGMTIEELQGLVGEDVKLEAGVEITIPSDKITIPDLEGLELAEGGSVTGEFLEVVVQPHYTLSGIARDNGLNWNEIKDHVLEDNPEITNPDEIDIDQVIKLRWSDINVDTEDSKSQIEESVNEAVGDESTEIEKQADVKYTLGEQDTSELEDSLEEDLEDVADDVEITGTAQATLDQTNNANEVRSGVEADVQSAMAPSIPASTTVQVTLDWQITNPTASISVGVSGGSATATIASAGMAEGGYLDSPHIMLAGEDGPEFVVPVSAKHRDRGVELWREAGAALGMPAYADGGVVGGSVSPVISGAPVATGEPEGGTTGETKQISITVNPSIVVNGGDGASISDQADQIADQIAQIIAERIGEVFDNMPESA